MKSPIRIVGLVALAAAFARAEEPKPAEHVLCEGAWRIDTDDKDARTVGVYKVRGERNAGNGEILIREEMERVQKDGVRMGYRSLVVYREGTPPVPVRAEAETWVDGQPTMKGTITFADGKMDWECTGFWDPDKQTAIDPPSRTEKKGVEVPEGVVLFQSAVAVLGPLLLAENGKETPVVWVEFPDDIEAPELVVVKTGRVLKRRKADTDGSFVIEVCSESRVTRDYVLDARNQILSLGSQGRGKIVRVGWDYRMPEKSD